MLRNNFGTDHESYFLFKMGPINQHFDSDEGSFHWYAHGRPISLDFGSMYTPSIEQPRLELRKDSLHGITEGAAGNVVLRWTPPVPAKPRVSVDGRALDVSKTPNGEITFPVPEGRHDFQVTY